MPLDLHILPGARAHWCIVWPIAQRDSPREGAPICHFHSIIAVQVREEAESSFPRTLRQVNIPPFGTSLDKQNFKIRVNVFI
jgi:hypothetical protein